MLSDATSLPKFGRSLNWPSAFVCTMIRRTPSPALTGTCSIHPRVPASLACPKNDAPGPSSRSDGASPALPCAEQPANVVEHMTHQKAIPNDEAKDQRHRGPG